ncbi:hypothetical protein HanRHA438_Chr10g0441541 [Helianthus annuus]|nr:hypothetical protein HanRHA438_Chr10g0441541 [Helianthus annuus]
MCISPKLLLLTIRYMILNGIYSSFLIFFILYVESYLFSKHNIFFIFLFLYV